MLRFAPPVRGAAALLLVALVAAPTSAEERREEASPQPARLVINPVPNPVPVDSLRPLELPRPAPDLKHERPAALMPLYSSFVALQALDVHSTRMALANGGVEANPAMQGVVGSTAGVIAMKAAGAAGVIFASEQIRKKNKAAAIGLMIATNSAMAWVVQHNYRIAR